MAWYEWILSILLFIVSLGILITIHEAGHLSMAKLFNVYCNDFSIGFGPKIFRIKRKNQETAFTLRAVPLGGFVSMYGEGAEELPEFKDIPKERSIEGVKKWKKSIIVLAGVILNAILAFVLILISNLCFPYVQQSSVTEIKENSIAQIAGVQTNDRLGFIYSDDCVSEDGIAPYSYDYTASDGLIHMGNFFIVDNTIEMIPASDPVNLHHYVLTFMFTGDKGNSVLTDGIKLYPAVTKSEVLENENLKKTFEAWVNQEGSPEYYPNFTVSNYLPGEGTSFTANIKFLAEDDSENVRSIQFTTENKNGKYVWKDVGISFKIRKVWLPVGDRFKNTFIQYGDASIAVFKGLATLFKPGGIRNMSGLVGIFETSSMLLSQYTFATYLYFWGMISVNLAIFNLLPFPGLDGWQLLVTIIEGISKKKIPAKLKSIMSLIGLGLLFLLMIVILVFDVIRIVG